ncbi:hypothetical protein ACCAA_1170023 [Candidatus Accumulibacter aalborgensis]|uniref:RNA polymerase alpha subunit C-terminal domain-containing protein n=2 Tax=Candidatus Accumulibacter aalborgensis TaxID=1860102 RepID=A0A1A8XFD8_9PROT|nr:hypothetical protein ACCAA_1170023 [Candidatus Accumulibacter aalborgensis]
MMWRWGESPIVSVTIGPDEEVVDVLDLPFRAGNALRAGDINTMADLLARSKEELLQLPNFGKKSLNEVIDALDKRGLALGHSIPTPGRERRGFCGLAVRPEFL